RPGTMEKLGLGYEALREINPGLIYAVCSGYGSTGPYKDRPGQDMLLQALSGLIMRTGKADGPPTPVGSPVVHHHAASLYASSILAALYAKARTGKGRLVEVSLYQAALHLQIEPIMAWMNGARSDGPRAAEGIASWCSVGPYGPLATADGHLVIAMAAPSALARALDIEALAGRPDSDNFDKREEVTALVAERLREKTTAQWMPVLTEHKIWHAPVQDYDALRQDPQLSHLGVFETADSVDGEPVTFMSYPARFDGQAPGMRRVPQALGAQTREVLAEAGYAPAEIEALQARGIVRDANDGAAT